MDTVDIVVSLISRVVALGVIAFAFRRLVPHFDHENDRASWPLAFVVAGALVGAGFVASLFDVGLLAGAAVQLAAAGVAGKLAFRISIPLSIGIALIGELLFVATALGVAAFVVPLVMMSPIGSAIAAAVTVGFVLAVSRWRRLDPAKVVGD